MEFVVIAQNVDHYTHPSGIFVSRSRELGLTGYGNTVEEAEGNRIELLKKFISTYSSSGQMETRLDQAGVKWWRVAPSSKADWAPMSSTETKHDRVPVPAL